MIQTNTFNYVEAVLSFIDNLVVFESTVFSELANNLQSRIDQLDLTTHNLDLAVDQVNITLETLHVAIEAFHDSIWATVSEQSLLARAIVSRRDVSKADLLASLAAGGLQNKTKDVDKFFSTLRFRGRDLADRWQQLTAAWQRNVQTVMLETVLTEFYRLVKEDYLLYVGGRNGSRVRPGGGVTAARGNIAAVLGIEAEILDATPADTLLYQLNADYETWNLSEKFQDIENAVRRLEEMVDIADQLGDLDKTLQHILSVIRGRTQELKKPRTVDLQFYTYVFGWTELQTWQIPKPPLNTCKLR